MWLHVPMAAGGASPRASLGAKELLNMKLLFQRVLGEILEMMDQQSRKSPKQQWMKFNTEMSIMRRKQAPTSFAGGQKL